MHAETIFGPAGYPLKGPKGPDAMAYLASEGLFAMEYQAVRSVRIGRAAATMIRDAAKRNDVVLTIHAPYAISLSSEDRTIASASKKRLIMAAMAGHHMGTFHVTFHAGFYGRRTKEETFRLQLKALQEITARLESLGVGVELGPETTGKQSQFGTLDELIELSRSIPRVRPTLDFGHMHVRSVDSKFRGSDDCLNVLSRVERDLGTERSKSLVLHFSEVQPTAAGFGEKRHWPLGSSYGPKFEYLAEAMAQVGYNMVVICESPLLDKDAIKMKGIYEKKLSIG